MTEERLPGKQPLWMLIEEQIVGLSDKDVLEANLEATASRVAGELDETGYNVSRSGGNWMRLTTALEQRAKAGKSLMTELRSAVDELKLEDLDNTEIVSRTLISRLGEDFPGILPSDRRPDVLEMVDETRLALLVKKAKSVDEEQGIRLLIAEEVSPENIVARMEVSQERYDEVLAKVEAEKAERDRVRSLLDGVEGKPVDEQVKHLLNSDVADALITEVGGFEQSVIDGVKKAMEAELAEKKRLEEEAAAAKAAAAAGPALEDISDDDMLEHIEAIREILDFSDKEKEIRVMCEQSSIPKALVDIAVSEPDKLDELEKKAGG